ncbi:PIG-L deacetylase family protein [Sulfitobacter sp. 1A12779]|uniref:PIG-L deacetylase family protein n=1 Tax=Sulfitobacter sp. 1A12779 TaxID=3368599 RepID=UPI003745EEC0
MKRILVVVAHSDDEALGCGGTLAAQADRGAEIAVMFLTNGVGARRVAQNDPRVTQRAEASRAACKVMGVKTIFQRDFPDNQLDSVPLLDVVQSVEEVVAEFKPDIILTHFDNDLNVDHRVCHQAVLTACRPQPGHSVRTILSFEVPSSTEWAFSAPAFSPNVYVDISAHTKHKQQALEAYSGEMHAAPHVRSIKSIEALARWRGATVGVEAAEGFCLIRQISKEI